MGLIPNLPIIVCSKLIQYVRYLYTWFFLPMTINRQIITKSFHP